MKTNLKCDVFYVCKDFVLTFITFTLITININNLFLKYFYKKQIKLIVINIKN